MVDQFVESLGVVAEESRVRFKGRILDVWRALSRTERLFLAILIMALCARFAARPWAPFWLDEAATGAIISQPDFESFWKQVYWEVSSPLYFIFMRVWQAIFGLSNLSLRAPSILFSIAAPLCIFAANLPGVSRQEKLSWAALLALWIPGIGYAQDARCYALVLLLSTLQTIAYIRLLDVPSVRNSAIWVFFVALTVAAHYDAAFLALFEGLFFVGLKPRSAIKCLPTGIIMIPTIAIILWQWPEMVRFMGPDTTWYKPLTIFGALKAGLYLLGSGLWFFVMPVLLVAAAIDGRRYPSEFKIPGHVVWAAIASVIGVTALIVLAMYRPILAPRYLAPFAPGVLLFVIVTMHILARGAARSSVSTVVGSSAAILAFWLVGGAHHGDSVVEELSYETASNAVMQFGARYIVFAWDNPNARAMHPEQIKEFGAFFFKRAGYNVEVIPAQIGKDQDPNALLLNAARPAHAAILWVYDTWVRGTAARRFPPNISQLDSEWKCQNTRKQNFGIVMCLPRARTQ